MEEPSAGTRLATGQGARPRVPLDPSGSRVPRRSPMRDCGGPSHATQTHAHRQIRVPGRWSCADPTLPRVADAATVPRSTPGCDRQVAPVLTNNRPSTSGQVALKLTSIWRPFHERSHPFRPRWLSGAVSAVSLDAPLLYVAGCPSGQAAAVGHQLMLDTVMSQVGSSKTPSYGETARCRHAVSGRKATSSAAAGEPVEARSGSC